MMLDHLWFDLFYPLLINFFFLYVQILKISFELWKTELENLLLITGTGLLPGPVDELHAIHVNDTEVTLHWEPPKDGSNVTDYVIHYKKVDNTTMHETVPKLDNVSFWS